MIQQMLAVWSLVPFAFSKSSLNIWKFSFHVLLKPSLENFEPYFGSMWNECSCCSLNILWHCLSLGLEWKLTFSNPVAPAEFSKFAGILSATFQQHHLLGFEIAQLLYLVKTGGERKKEKRVKSDKISISYLNSLSLNHTPRIPPVCPN